MAYLFALSINVKLKFGLDFKSEYLVNAVSFEEYANVMVVVASNVNLT